MGSKVRSPLHSVINSTTGKFSNFPLNGHTFGKRNGTTTVLSQFFQLSLSLENNAMEASKQCVKLFLFILISGMSTHDQ